MLPRQSSSTAAVAGSSNGISGRKISDRVIVMKTGSAPQLPAELPASSSGWTGIGCGDQVFLVGDKVRVIAESEEELKRLQEGHGGWNQRMARFIGKVGTIHRATENGDLRVKFEDSLIRWTFNPVALAKVPVFAVGDMVRVMEDVEVVKALQVNHGEWVDQMRYALGKKGKVVIVYRDNDLRVTMVEGTPGTTYTLNPSCVTLVTHASALIPTSDHTNASSGTDVLAGHHVACDATTSTSSPQIHRHSHPQQQPVPDSTAIPTSTSSSSAILVPASTQASAGGPDDGPTGDEVNRMSSNNGSTAEISDLLRQVQLRDTKFKCSRTESLANSGSSAPGPGPHSAPDPAGSLLTPAWPQDVHMHSHLHPQHGQHVHHHRSPVSSSSSRHQHASPVLTGSHHHHHAQQQQLHPVQQQTVTVMKQQAQHSSPSSGRPSVLPALDSGKSLAATDTNSAETVAMLKSKIAQIEDMITCNICMEQVKNIVFMCGHGSCSTCSAALVSCHMCRMPITGRIQLYS